MKDPAFLFYPADFLGGVSDLTMEERGQYITLLCIQHQRGSINTKRVGLILGLEWVSLSSELRGKFNVDENGEARNADIEITRTLKNVGIHHWKWRGGITSENQEIRNSPEMRQWRKNVFQRDKYTCQKCGCAKGPLHAHHIRPFALFPELRFEINNGLTLCRSCHLKLHSKNNK